MRQYQVSLSKRKPVSAQPLTFLDFRIMAIERVKGKYKIRSLTVCAGSEPQSISIASRMMKENFTHIFTPPLDYNVLEHNAYSLS